jgi:hypothetical protein
MGFSDRIFPAKFYDGTVRRIRLGCLTSKTWCLMLRISQPNQCRLSSLLGLYVDPLRQSLRRILAESLDSRFDMTAFAIILLRLAEEAVISIHEWRNRPPPAQKQLTISPKLRYLSSTMTKTSLRMYQNSQLADIDTIDDSRLTILGLSPTEICKGIPQEYQVLNIEPVFRDDLILRFRQCQQEIHRDLSTKSYSQLRECVSFETIPRASSLDNCKDLAKELSGPRLSFHGTKRSNVSSIVCWGFLKPGQSVGSHTIPTRCGSTYGSAYIPRHVSNLPSCMHQHQHRTALEKLRRKTSRG